MTRQTGIFWPPRGKAESPIPFRHCDHPGCAEAGEFRAPKSREALTDYYWFCLSHVRNYNAAWDYYAGMRPDEIERMVRLDTTWQRPTWPLGGRTAGVHFSPERVRDPFNLFGEEDFQSPQKRPDAASPEQAAIKTMGLSFPFTLDGLKAKYKELCKLHHPDANGGDKEAEERFKRIGQAYQTLLAFCSH